ncbi:MAG TPA: D-arabinono-1,4-lactone oxidase [Jatrophihabitantaceae bacterium]|jgi:L-gulonolactone oxidase
MAGDTGWSNWAGNQSVDGIAVTRPRGTDEIARAIADARRAERRIRPIGSGHSFTGIGRPDTGAGRLDTVQLRLDRHADLVHFDGATGQVTVQAGMPLHRLNVLLQHAGRALTNLGDIDVQTVAGAFSTGTHGTGARFGGLATQIRGLSLVLADGSVLNCSATSHVDVFRSARVGLGSLGVISTVTLQTEPAFVLHAEEGPAELADVLASFDELADGTDHFEFYWFPHTTRTLTKRNMRVSPEILNPLPRWRSWLGDEFLSNTVFGGLVAAGRRAPRLVRPLNQLAARALGSRSYSDLSHRVFTSPRRVRFVEMEYAIPRASLVPVLSELRRTVDASTWNIAFPVEVRVAAADDITLSTAFGRDSAYIAVHVPLGAPDQEAYFGTLERLAGEVGGRPHWGKLHGLDAAILRARYPRFDEFVALRDRLDPDGMFANEYLDRVLGPPVAARSVA